MLLIIFISLKFQGAGIAVTVGVDCLEPELSNTDLEAIISDSEQELPSSLPSRYNLIYKIYVFFDFSLFTFYLEFLIYKIVFYNVYRLYL